MRLWCPVMAAVLLFSTPALALCYDSLNEFSRGTIVVTPQVGGGINNSVERRFTTITQVSGTMRLSLQPLDPIGKGFWHASLETGLEPWFQYYPEQGATAEGLKVAARYHFLGASPVFPYVEGLAGAGGTSLKVKENRSNFALVLKAAGLPLHFTPHSLRHTYASLLLQMGVSPVYVQRQLGHSSIKLTADLYGRWLPNGKQGAGGPA